MSYYETLTTSLIYPDEQKNVSVTKSPIGAFWEMLPFNNSDKQNNDGRNEQDMDKRTNNISAEIAKNPQ
jgi:hypothetical protein